MRRNLLLGFVLAALTLGVYWPVRTHDFIYYDDPEFITENLRIQSGLSWATFKYAFTQPVVGNWHPVTTLSHALDCELFGVRPGAHHLVNAVVHALNTGLLFLLLQEWVSAARRGMGRRSADGIPGEKSGRVWLCFVGAALFALHPLRVESVAWVAERKDVLSGWFFLLSLWLYTRYARQRLTADPDQTQAVENGGEGRRTGHGAALYLAALICFALGLMSKPMVVTLPFVLLLLDYWPLRRFEIATISSVKFQIAAFRGLLLEKLPCFLLSAIDCWITFAVQRSAGAMQIVAAMSWPERLANVLTSYCQYLGKFFWPTKLAVIYPHPAKHYYLSDAWPGWEIVLAVLLLTLSTAFCVLEVRRRPYLIFGWLWYLGTLVPVIGLVQVGEQAMADRYTYIPLIGPVVCLICVLGEIMGSRGASLSFRFQRAGPENEGSPSPQPSPPGEGEEKQPIADNAGFARYVAICLIVILALLTRHQLAFWKDSVRLFEHAVAVTADNPSAQFSLGVGLEKQGDVRKAMVRYRVATAIDPKYSKAYYNMGQLLRKGRYWDAAVEAYMAAARLNPNDLPTQLNLASVLPRAGRNKEAIAHFERALELEPNSIEGLNNLAWLLATSPDSQVGDGARAVSLAERACELSGFKVPVLLGTLAAAYAEAGRFNEAILTAEQACARAIETGDLAAAEKNRELLELYRAKKPYRERVGQ